MLNTAVKAARRAAAVINRASFDLDRVSFAEKNPNDFVTDVDRAAEEAVIEVLQKAYPSHAFLGEESGTTGNVNDESEFVWIIDPLDGTTNFIHGFPQYSVSIALQQRGVITLGVVYDPVRNELFTAEKGAGAFLNEKRIRVRKLDRIGGALLGTGYKNGSPKALEEYLKMYGIMAERSHGVRRAGSAALDLAYVACGRLDGYYEKNLQAWDIAAGTLLVTEAGGIAGEFNGESNYLQTGHVIAGSPRVFGQMVGLLAEFS
jgi:myo-inositol-1(or 4)-monophosphatase